MSRNRIIYQSEALFVSPAVTGDVTDTVGAIPSTSTVNLQRVTEISNNAEITRQNVNVFGRLASISREIIEEPTVSMDFKYYLGAGFNESGIGLLVANTGVPAVNCISGILSNADNQKYSRKNYYVYTVKEGSDANTLDPQGAQQVLDGAGIIGIGNAYLTNYTVDASVGEIPSASVSVEAANISFDLADIDGVQNPSINISGARLLGKVSLDTPDTGNMTDLKVLRPGDIVMDFGSDALDMGGAILPGMTGYDTKQSAHIQSFSLELPLSRTPLRRLGNAFAFSRELDVPIDVTLNVTANMGDFAEGSLEGLICAGSAERDISIKMYRQCGAGDESDLALVYTLKGATLDSQNMSSTIGDSKTVELVFRSQIGGPEDQSKGLFINGTMES